MSSLPGSARPLRRPSQTSRRPLPELPSEASTTPASTAAPPPSPSSALNRRARPVPRLEPVFECSNNASLPRDEHQHPPGDVVTPARPNTSLQRRESFPAMAHQKTPYFEEASSSGEEASAGGQDPRESAVVLAEVKTNVFVSFTSFVRLIRAGG